LALARGMGVSAAVRTSVGTDAVNELESICLAVQKEFPKTTFFAGRSSSSGSAGISACCTTKRRCRPETSAVAGRTMVILPARVV